MVGAACTGKRVHPGGELVETPMQKTTQPIGRTAPKQQPSFQQRKIQKTVEPIALRPTAYIRPHRLSQSCQRIKICLPRLIARRAGHPNIHTTAKFRRSDGFDDTHIGQVFTQNTRCEIILTLSGEK